MKLTLSIFMLLSLTLSLNASEEFPLIEPYAVEEAPVVMEVEATPVIQTAPVKKAPVEEEVVKEKTNSIEVVKLDDDDDGVINEKDKCPNTSSDFMVDGYGCPQTMVLNIKFPFGKARVTDEIIEEVKDFAQFLQDNPGYQVIIYGHTDSIGSEEFNQKLSKERADVVKEALVRYDISEIRLTAIGKGEKEPIADNMYEDGRAKNRRIEIELIQ